jgi:hypothetical protein
MALSKIETSSLDIGQVGGRRNLLINSAFQVNQRGSYTSPTSMSTWTFYTDRWKSTYSTVSATIQYTDNVVKLTATSTGSSARILTTQSIERINIRPSTTYTYSAKVKSNSSNARLSAYINGAWTATAAHSGSGEWEDLSLTVTSSSSAQPDEVWLRIGIMDGSGDPTVTITSGDYFEAKEPQFEAGGQTPFEHRSYGEELSLCQRYYWRTETGNNSWLGFGGSNDVGNRYCDLNGRPNMRTTPTIGLSGSIGDFECVRWGVAWDTAVSWAVHLNTRSNTNLIIDTDVTSTDGLATGLKATGSSFFYADAEL